MQQKGLPDHFVTVLILLLAGFLLLITLAFYPTSNPRGIDFGVLASPCPGDCNMDRSRDLGDTVFLLKHLLGTNPLEGEAAFNADLNLDGEISVQDLVLLQRHLLGTTSLSDCREFQPETGPRILGIVPDMGPPGSTVVLRGWNFAPTPDGNFVVFHSLGAQTQAEVLEADEETLTLRVPDVPEELHAVTVAVAGLESPGASFEVASTSYQPITFDPNPAYVFMPPGTGRTRVVVGEGTPPYRLQPLAEYYEGLAEVTLDGNAIEVVGLTDERKTIQVVIEDSFDPPQTQTLGIFIETPPQFSPGMAVTFHTLLRGSSPGLSLLLRPRSRSGTGDPRKERRAGTSSAYPTGSLFTHPNRMAMS